MQQPVVRGCQAEELRAGRAIKDVLQAAVAGVAWYLGGENKDIAGLSIEAPVIDVTGIGEVAATAAGEEVGLGAGDGQRGGGGAGVVGFDLGAEARDLGDGELPDVSGGHGVAGAVLEVGASGEPVSAGLEGARGDRIIGGKAGAVGGLERNRLEDVIDGVEQAVGPRPAQVIAGRIVYTGREHVFREAE